LTTKQGHVINMSTIDEGNRKATNTRGRYPASPPTFMKHKHHIIPKHLGGTNEPDNIVEVTIEQHALLHKQLWEDLGHKEDFLAWQGLSKLMTTDECRLSSMLEGSKKGAAVTNAKRWSNHKKRERKYPKNTDGRKIRTKRCWYSNGIDENQFELDTAPTGWYRGRLKGVYGGKRT
jgi:hypothetical protein